MKFFFGCWIGGGANTIPVADPAIGCSVDDDIAAKTGEKFEKNREDASENEGAKVQEHLSKHSYRKK